MTLSELNKMCNGTLMDLLQIEFLLDSSGNLMASMPITDYHKQPMGYLHGGATIALAESLGSAASLYKLKGKAGVMAVQLQTSHIQAARQGMVIATASLIVEQAKLHIWDIEVRDDQGQLLSITRLSNRIINRSDE